MMDSPLSAGSESEKKPASEPLPPALLLAVRDEVDRLQAKERKKYLLVATIFVGAFGLGTIGKVWLKVEEMVKAETDWLIQRTDSTTGVRRNLDDLVNRSIVTAAQILLQRRALAAPSGSPESSAGTAAQAEGPPLVLSDDKWLRLKAWIQNEDLSDDDFLDAVTVLGAQDKLRMEKDAKEILSGMLDPPAGSRFRWMLTQPNKRLAILRNFGGPGLEGAALGLVGQASASNEQRIAALEYLKSTQGAVVDRRTIVESLLQRTSDDPRLHFQALMTGAWLSPLDGHVLKEVDLVLGRSGRDDSDVSEALLLAQAFSFATSPAESSVLKELQEGTNAYLFTRAKELLTYAFRHDATVVALDSGTFGFFVSSSHGKYTAVELSLQDLAKMRAYWSILGDAAQRGDLKVLSALAPRSCVPQDLRALRVSLKDQALIAVGTLRLGAADVSAIDLASSRDKEGIPQPLHASWLDRSGYREQGVVTGLSGSGFSFSLPPDFASMRCGANPRPPEGARPDL